MDAGSVMAVIFWAFLGLIPTMLAWARNHANTLAIFAVNILIGWSGIGWVVAFIWACTNNVKPRTESQAKKSQEAFDRAKERERKARELHDETYN